jgi:chloramphenicol-sensitive protein RarD
MREPARGVLFGVAAYSWWGLVPIYFKALAHVRPLEVLAHRIVWSVVVLVILVSAGRRWPALIAVARKRAALRLLILSTLLIAGNWYLYIWAVAHSHIVEASLGYFITPLVSVLLGVVFLRERLRPLEIVSIVLAAVAVSWLAVIAGVFPWISVGIAVSFAGYGLVRKVAAVPSMEGLTIETALLLPVALAYVAINTRTFEPLLPLSGPITALPLLWFASAVERLRLSTIGLLQYISPTIQVLVAVLMFGEAWGSERLVAFALIWIAIALYSFANARKAAGLSPALRRSSDQSVLRR